MSKQQTNKDNNTVQQPDDAPIENTDTKDNEVIGEPVDPKPTEQEEQEIEYKTQQLSKTHLTPFERDDFDMSIINNWSRLVTKNPPKRRSSHSAFIYENKYLYVLGGVDITERKQNDIYRINLNTENPEWEKVNTGDKELEKIAYHAGVLHDDIYYIIGGQDSSLRSSNHIQKFNVKEHTIEEPIIPEETSFPPLEGHTADLNGNSIIIYGGHTNKKYNKNVYCFNFEDGSVTKLTDISDVHEETKPKNKQQLQKQSTNVNEEGKAEGENNDANANNEVDEEDKFPRARQSHCSCIYNNALYIYGGYGPDETYYMDLWKFDLGGNTFTKIDFDCDVESCPGICPLGRSGCSMIEYEGMLYIFGGKLGLIKESNEMWRFNLSANRFELVHDTLIEQFTAEELEKTKIVANDDKLKKKFRLLTRHEVEQRTNPLPFSLKNKKNKNKNKKDPKSTAGTFKTEHSSSNQHNHSFTEKKDTYSGEVLARPNVTKMKKSLIYTSNGDELHNALNELGGDEKAMLDKESALIVAEVPEPRDCQTVLLYRGKKFVVFGGDRNKFPFNDLYFFNPEGVTGVVAERKQNEEEKAEGDAEGEAEAENKEEGGQKEETKEFADES